MSETKPGRLYARCTFQRQGETHGVPLGSACVPCERDFADKMKDHERHPDRYAEPGVLDRVFATDHPAYALMEAEGRAVGWPAHWKADLYDLDRWFLTVWPTWSDRERPFLWVLRDCGTQLVEAWPGPTDFSRPIQTYIRGVRVAAIFGTPNCKFYVWTGAVLVPCESPEAADKLLDDEDRTWRRARAAKVPA